MVKSAANPGPRVRSLAMNAALGGSPRLEKPDLLCAAGDGASARLYDTRREIEAEQHVHFARRSGFWVLVPPALLNAPLAWRFWEAGV